MQWKITLAEPQLGQEEIDAVVKVLQSKWLTMGAVTAEFEQKFAQKLGVKHAFAVNNCTAALHLANVVLGVKQGDEVICPALTFVASANASRYTGAEVVFADSVSEHDLTIDPADIERRITSKTRAITVVHYGGYAANMEAILAIAQKHNLKVIEDCAHSPFASYTFKDGSRQYTGTIGDVGCFSFFGNKNMTTGEGGMIVTNSDELAAQIKLMRSHGMTTLSFERHKGHAASYDVVSHGYNYRSDDIHSAIGLAQLAKIDDFNEKRRQVFAWYLEALKDKKNIIVPFASRDLAEGVCHIMPVIVLENYDQVRETLKQNGVQTSKHYELIPSFTAFAGNSFHSRLPLLQNILTLPMSPALTREDVQYIAGLL